MVKTPWRNIKMIFLDSNFVLGNAVAPPDYPIVYCSDGFCELTGISISSPTDWGFNSEISGLHRAEVMQQPALCPWLWGTSPDLTLRSHQRTVLDLFHQSQYFRTNVLEAFDFQIELKLSVQFYKKSGEPFWCLLDITPIRNELGKVVLFLISYKDITSNYTPSRSWLFIFLHCAGHISYTLYL